MVCSTLCMCSIPSGGEMIHLILYEYYFRKLNNHSVVDTNSSPFFLHLTELSCRLRIYILFLGIKAVARKPEVRAWVWKRGFTESSLRDRTGKAFWLQIEESLGKGRIWADSSLLVWKKEKDLPLPRDSAHAGTLAKCKWTGESLVVSRIPSNLRVRKAMF